jgi:alpha-glucosidase (family GH31 glycosyl hydrolase)
MWRNSLTLLASLCSVFALVHSAQQCANVYPHLSCGLELHESQAQCIAKGCCWDNDSSAQHPCFAPAIYGYNFSPPSSSSSSSSSEPGVTEGTLRLNAPSGLQLGGSPDYEELKLELTQETPSRTHLKIYPPSEPERWEVPETLLPRAGGVYSGDESMTQSHIISQPDGDNTYDSMMLLLSRTGEMQADKDMIFSLTKMLVFQDQYLQMVLGSPSDTVATFGLGESSRLSQQLQTNTTYTLWNTDDPASVFNKTLYGSHPFFFMQISASGQAHGVLFLNSNAMDVTLSSSSDGQGDTISIQATGGLIDLYIFAGPSPEDVVQQYLETLDIFPALVPRWALGFHNCRWGYENIQQVREVVANYSRAHLPLEVQWLDIDYMDRYLDFTLDPVNFPQTEMDAFINTLHSNQQYFVPIIDPAISMRETPGTYPAYDDGMSQDIFVKDLNGEEPYLGQVWPGPAFFPDFFAANTSSYWTEQLRGFYHMAEFDGIWIDMNEASNFCNYGGGGQGRLSV